MKNANVETKEQIDMQSTEQSDEFICTAISTDIFNDDFGTGIVQFQDWVVIDKVEDGLIHVRIPVNHKFDSLVKYNLDK